MGGRLTNGRTLYGPTSDHQDADLDTGDKNPYSELVYAEYMVVPCPEY